MGSHESHTMLTDEWLTPPEIIKALGPFDLDPCSPITRPWDTALKHYSILDMGLLQPWEGRVWMNPPYGQETGRWMERLAAHSNGIALIFARTETEMFRRFVWEKADAVFFFYGRLSFYRVDGTQGKTNSGAPSCLVAYGEDNIKAIEASGLKGYLVRLQRAPHE